jgi:pantoate--beta-alanine ligase
MKQIESIEELRVRIRNWRENRHTVAFVPTMGNLHDGHLQLVKRAKTLADKVVVSIFVNPLQFGVNEDFDKYPRTLQQDAEKLATLHTDVLFYPQVAEMYPQGMTDLTRVIVPDSLKNTLCGKSRPGHFDGVATVVNLLFQMVQPDKAVFGLKDFQQFLVIQRMVADLHIPVEMIGEPTMRETDGLAMSSRNQYLSSEERQHAPLLFKTLQDMRQKLLLGKNSAELCSQAIDKLQQNGFKMDYLDVRRQQDLAPISSDDKNLIILVAAWLGTTRLIDNLPLQLTDF